MNNIGLEATSITSGDIHPLSFPTFLLLIALVILIGILSSRALRIRSQAVGNLFLKMFFQCNDKNLHGFLRTLDGGGATLVSNFRPDAGQTLILDLSSLPGFPRAKTQVNASVAKIRALGGSPKSYLIEVIFDQNLKDKFEAPLNLYLKQLTT